MAGEASKETRNGIASKILTGLVVTLVGSGVVGIWNMRADVAAIAATVVELTRRLDRLEETTEVKLERQGARLDALERGRGR